MGQKSRPTPLAGEEARPNVVPMPSFVDPNWPEAAGASVNYGHDKYEGVDQHPLVHNPSYGQVHGGLGTAEGTDEDGNTAPLTGADGEPVEPGYTDMTNDQLKDELRKRDLPVSGNNAELVQRLRDDDDAKAAAAAEDEGGAS